MTHEAWVLVCPATHRPIRDRAEPKPGVQPAIPPAPVPRPTAINANRALIGRVIGDRYVVRSLIGEGGMGVVYEAEHLTIGRLVAIKVIHPKRAQDREAISRLRHEARVAGTLGHPNICAIYDMGRLDDGSPYLVMERLHGETLAQRLRREGRVSVEDLTDIVLQVLSALVVTHQQGIVHRDLKPDNIFLSRREGMPPIPKLLDFGISKAEDIEDSLLDPMGTSTPMGTPYYMAPEQARGERTFDHRVDLWALGVVLYESLTGKRPFDAKNYNALLVHILSATPQAVAELIPSVPVDVARVIDKALAKEPRERFQSAKDMQQALHLARDLEPVSQAKRFAAGRELEGQPSSSKPITMIRELELPPIPSSRRVPPLRESDVSSVPLARRGMPGREAERPATPASRRGALTRESEAQAVPSSRPIIPIVVEEPSNDDSDSTFIFSRLEMGFGTAEEPRKAAWATKPKEPEGALSSGHGPSTEAEEEHTLVEGQNLNDSTTLIRPDKTPGPPKRKD